ncbi:Far upstream element-binding protein 2 [Seminavis robusta]|uniref:Far upstream element-binding protein 2 n=1 Tax=Seminavis robusta TaxID=568900 RepID=A0A9N8H4G2_9STRA|nr:Far upstream element-binding protein 2 [Seminavis robusta]|eukprot:Sro84_g044640.1 Far upstream element-binding protein 2 (685) ;mRNA; r:12469-14961
MSSAEEAARKAREIAAKLMGGGGSSPTASAPAPATTSTGKRKRWGVAPSAVADASGGANAALPGLDAMAKKLKQEAEPVQKRLWITSCVSIERPAWHYVSFMSPRLDEIIQKVSNLLKTDPKELEISFKGRGSSREPPLPGIPEEPLHVFVKGPKETAEEAELEIDTLLQEAEKAEVTIDITQEPEYLAANNESAGPENDRQLAIVGGQGHNGSYRPATVAQLIGGNANHPAASNSGDWPAEEVHVPNGVVGFIIGRGGETITSMQARTGAKVQIQKEHELQPGQTMRIITVSAPTKEAVEQCKTIITSMVEDRVGKMGGFDRRGSSTMGGERDSKVQAALDQGHVLKTVEVPDKDVGLIIGKGGATIQDIQNRTGASIQIPQSASNGGSKADEAMRTVSVTHPNETGAQEAVTMITAILASKKSANEGGGGGGGGGGPQTTIQVMIPDQDVGLCIGRQGCVIKEMQNKTRTRIQIPGQPTPGQSHRIATVSGTTEACEQVRQLIERISAEQSSNCVTGGGGPGGGGGGYNQYGGGGYGHGGQQQGGQQDYSAEWAAYYAAQEVAQKQQQAPAPAPTPAPAPAPASDTYYEQFFRYAYYYGETAARQYYGAWSPAPGTPNPYGVNPDGVTAPPESGAPAGPSAPAPAPSPQPAPAAAAPSRGSFRDTSVRKVSNLPAWMTRGQK